MLKGYSFKKDGIILDDYAVNLTGTPAIITASGTNATGTAKCFMPFQGDYYKKVIIYLSNFQNTGSAQTWNFPIAFTNTPVKVVDSATSGVVVSVSSVTFPGLMTSAITG